MAEVSITSSPVDFEVLSEQWEWAMFRGIDFIADAIQEYFDASNHDINPLSRIGQRHSLWNFYKTLNSVEMKDLDFQLVESFDHLVRIFLYYLLKLLRIELIFTTISQYL